MTDFYTLWTDTGLTKLGDAALETPFNITTAVVGDGSEAFVIPNKGMVSLVNQVWSGPVGSKVRSTGNSNTIIFEFAIPAVDGPFYIREIGLKDADGNLCIVGNFPDTEKPVAVDGSVRDMVLRVPVHFENADVVSLVVNPDIVLASKADVLVHALKQLDPTDTDTVKDKHTSNAQAKKWEDHTSNGGIHASQAEKNAWNGHPTKKNNPHAVTKSQVGLGALPNAKSDSVALNDSNTLATAKAVKAAYDLANHKHYYSDGTVALKGTRTTTGTWTLTGLTINKPLFLIAGSKSVASYMVFKVSSGTVQNGGRSSQWWRFQSAATHLVATTPSCILIPSSTTVVISLTSTIQGAVAAFQ